VREMGGSRANDNRLQVSAFKRDCVPIPDAHKKQLEMLRSTLCMTAGRASRFHDPTYSTGESYWNGAVLPMV